MKLPTLEGRHGGCLDNQIAHFLVLHKWDDNSPTPPKQSRLVQSAKVSLCFSSCVSLDQQNHILHFLIFELVRQTVM